MMPQRLAGLALLALSSLSLFAAEHDRTVEPSIR